MYDKIHNGSGEIDETLHSVACQNDVVRIEFVMASVCILNVLRTICIHCWCVCVCSAASQCDAMRHDMLVAKGNINLHRVWPGFFLFVVVLFA